MIRTVIVLVGMLIVSTPAFADDMAQWEDYLRRGSEAYDDGDYQTALLLYGKAQRLVDAPKLRMQMADIYEKLEECNAARLIYVTIIEDEELAGTEVRQEAARRLEVVGTCAREQPPEPAPEPAADLAPPVPPAAPVEAGAPPSRAWKRWGWGLVGTGGGLVVLSGVVGTAVFMPAGVKECMGINARADCTDYAAQKGVSTSEARDRAERVRSQHGLATILLFGTGVAVLGTGVVVLLAGKKQVAVHPTMSGVQVIARF